MYEKNTTTKLPMNDRAGSDMAKHERSPLATPLPSADAETISAKYSRWFNGEAPQPVAIGPQKNQFRQILSTMTAREVADATRENLSLLGDNIHGLFSAKLPAGNRMRKAIRSTVLPSTPHLGSCKFGEIVMAHTEDTFSVLQLFVANFDGDFDTTSGGTFYIPRNSIPDRMFFGVNILVDRDGTPLGFDLERGINGIAFKTKDATEAFYTIASATTGLSIAELHARTLKPGRK